jgi:hypothetical protein
MHKLLSGSVVQESANSADAPDVEISFFAQALNLLLHREMLINDDAQAIRLRGVNLN